MPGGMVCRTYDVLISDGQRVVVKRCPFAAATEAEDLTALAKAGVAVPAVLGAAGRTLVLERVSGTPDWPELARGVAGMHRVVGPAYGWPHDNHAGRFVQSNGWLESWPEFYAERRVRTHLADPAVPAALGRRLDRACDGPLQDLLPMRPAASLTHGDLWAGNVVAGRWLVDPEPSHADRELDLAYMHMSQSLPTQFWGTYFEAYPLADGFERRRSALQLHHLLLQVRHFGPARYEARIEAVLNEYGW